MHQRKCSDCTLCCKLIPVRELHKKAGNRCQHQQFHKGCKIYPDRPTSCRIWSCLWLTNEDTADLARPDRSHYVLDAQLDYVTVLDHTTQHTAKMPVVQIWVDPKYPNAHLDPALRRYLLRQSDNGVMGLVRYNSRDGFTLIPPTMTSSKQWLEIVGEQEPEHTPRQLLEEFDLEITH